MSKMRYNNGKEVFDVNFEHYPDKYEQIKICKARGVVIDVIIKVGDNVRKITSDNLSFYN